MALNKKQQLFVTEYLQKFNATQSAIVVMVNVVTVVFSAGVVGMAMVGDY